MQDTLEGENVRVRRCLILIVSGTLAVSACGGGGMAPVVERSSTAPGSSPSAQMSADGAANAASQAAESDWTATVRPLGDSGSTASRALPGEESVAAPASASSPAGPAVAPASGAASAAGANPAVVSLLNTASAQSRAGDQARAAATLERAIAIEPKNAWLWHRLADTRLKEGRLDQAVELAAKSNSLSDDRGLQADNWKLIAEVRRRLGDVGGAAAAESQAAALSN